MWYTITQGSHMDTTQSNQACFLSIIGSLHMTLEMINSGNGFETPFSYILITL